MARTVEDLLSDAMELPADDRVALAQELLWSLRSEEEREIALEWAAVAEKRAAEIDNGTSETVSFDDAMENARRAVRDVAARTAQRR